jgi:Carboxypeptidase regulatory-like domain/TonB-dependent Receptor Plug Domain/TonB dependent receptor-like, beta-barrel
MGDLRKLFCGLAALSFFAAPTNLSAQVTTATLLGEVRDSSGAAVPGATVIARHQGTGVPREAISNERGEFVLTALPNGPYSVTISLTGFKTYTNEGIVLGAGQTARQAFTLEIGTVEESVLVSGEAPIVESAASLQAETLGSQEVRELPINRRNLTNLLGVAPGVSTSGGGDVQMNGVAGGGTGITVDGTEANSNPEERSMSHYGGQNQISVMSLDSIAEVQVVRGVLPAEYGGVAGGQVNVISRSGTNNLSGSAFYNFQSPTLNARSFFSTTPKGTGSFNQYGGTLGGPVVRNKLFFFATYEGYREEVELNLSGNVPNQNTRNALLAALPFPETKIALDTLPEPTEPIVSAAGVVDPARGRYRGLATRKRTENHVVAKGDFSVFNGANFATTYTRMRPWTLEPRINVNGSNDRVFPNAQDRIASHFVMAHGQWVSESRFGWNRTDLQRLDEFFNVMDPDPRAPAEIGNFGRRVGLINISGLFSTPSAEIYDLTGGTWSFDQKLSRTVGRHFIKTGFRWVRQTGDKMSPQNPQFAYQNLADTLANVPQSITVSFGAPRYKSHIDEFGGFIQDDWRLGSNLVLNLGIRYDYYATIRVAPTTEVPAEIVNLAPPTDLKKMDFGPPLDPQHPYEPDTFNVGPRLGFAWTLGSDNATVVRGGVGYLFSPHLPATVRQSVADPYVGFRQIWSRTEVAARRLTWPDYNDDFRNVVLADGGGRKTIFSVFDPEISAPYTIQSMLSVQRGISRTMAAEIGYIRTDGRSLPLQRQFTLAIDRQTGARPNPSLGAPGGYYVDSNQTLIYDGLQTSLRKRFSNRYSFDVNYTLGKGIATQGGDLAAYYLASIGNTQDFWNPEFDRGPADNDIRHRLNGTFIYEVPGISGGKGLLNGVLGGWQISGILSAASGGALTITQPSGITSSRPDVVPDVDLVVDDFESTCTPTGCTYLNREAFTRVPVSSVTNATLRAGSYKVGQARGPANWLLNSTFAKNFGMGGQRRLQVRADLFNVLNTKNFSNPVSNIDSTDFGRITDAQSARTMQLGMRLSF